MPLEATLLSESSLAYVTLERFDALVSVRVLFQVILPVRGVIAFGAFVLSEVGRLVHVHIHHVKCEVSLPIRPVFAHITGESFFFDVTFLCVSS